MIKNKQFDRFENFINAFGATRILLERAYNNGSLIEGLVLYASLVDGFCRMGLILKHQLDEENDHIEEKYIYQPDNKWGIKEGEIYKLASAAKIIDHELFDELNRLYKIRNKMIHRFFTSEIEYSHLEVVCERYERVYIKIRKVVYDLETEQIKKGVGITIDGGKMRANDRVDPKYGIMKKIKSGDEKKNS